MRMMMHYVAMIVLKLKVAIYSLYLELAMELKHLIAMYQARVTNAEL